MPNESERSQTVVRCSRFSCESPLHVQDKCLDEITDHSGFLNGGKHYCDSRLLKKRNMTEITYLMLDSKEGFEFPQDKEEKRNVFLCDKMTKSSHTFHSQNLH